MASSFGVGRRIVGHEGEIVARTLATPPTEPARPFGGSGEPPVRPPITANRPTKDEHVAELKRLLKKSAALETMLRDTVAGRKAAPVSDGPDPLQSIADAPQPRRRVRLAIGAAAVVALVAANAIALVHVHNRSPQTKRVVPASSPANVVAAASWVGRELSHNSRIVADPAMSAILAANRFTHAQTPAASPSGTALTFDYIASTAALRAAASAGGPIDRALSSSLPIALFGSGSDQVVVRQVSSASAADIAARRTSDSETRRTAEQQLLNNPAIRAREAARTALQAGQLDLRAATILALMANSSHVDILSVNVDEPERAAGLPARSVDVQTDAAAEVQAMLSNLPPLYQPVADTQLPDGTHRMVWSINPEPPPPLN